MSIASLFGADERIESLPADPNTSFTFALLYRRLGGSFSIGSNGNRYFGRPEPILFRMNAEEAGEAENDHLPQLAGAKPHERFHNADEWSGAIKLIEALLNRIDDADTEMVFGLLAYHCVDERKLRPVRCFNLKPIAFNDQERPG